MEAPPGGCFFMVNNLIVTWQIQYTGKKVISKEGAAIVLRLFSWHTKAALLPAYKVALFILG